MVGQYRVVIQNKRMHYDFTIKRNITIIRGDSATGKTTLINMVREFYQNGIDSGIDVKCDIRCVVLEGNDWEIDLQKFDKCLVFIDEGNKFITSLEFAKKIQETNNYYVIVTRESLPALPYSVEEVYGIRDSGKYGTIKKIYNELYGIYSSRKIMDGPIDLVVVEDSNAGFQFFEHVYHEKRIPCITAQGKSNVYSVIRQKQIKKVLVIADGAAFGAEMEKVLGLEKNKYQIQLFLPESFEWMILKSGLLADKNIIEVLECPEKYIESQLYFSWERFFTQFLVDMTQNTFWQYNKRKLNEVYLHEKNVEKILHSFLVDNYEETE